MNSQLPGRTDAEHHDAGLSHLVAVVIHAPALHLCPQCTHQARRCGKHRRVLLPRLPGQSHTSYWKGWSLLNLPPYARVPNTDDFTETLISVSRKCVRLFAVSHS
ncbi:hypothetical protein PSN13_05579 [Micromonospora saelicesensis]|uniref:Uncharacterized protein n=1 Tax=Micromonospora saelicesensis TaxID=285676 RepID=A0A328NF74_9ACTN|nr:hypothetical protein PSN13_05579 [Micromonospora saelicesensis]